MLVPTPKLKTIALFIAGLSAPACLFAYGNNPMFNGYYGGINLGVLQTNARLSSTATAFVNLDNTVPPATEELILSQPSVNVYNHNGLASIDLGYGHFYCDTRFYWAFEIFANWAKRKDTINTSTIDNEVFFLGTEDVTLSTSTTVKLNNTEYGIDFRPGYLLDMNTMLYGRLGLAFNQLKVTNNATFTFSRTDVDFGSFAATSPVQGSKSGNKTAVRLGFGLEHLITDQLAVTFDYIYTYYGKEKTSAIGDTRAAFVDEEEEDIVPVTTAGGLESSSSGRMATQTATLGLKYYFYPVC